MKHAPPTGLPVSLLPHGVFFRTEAFSAMSWNFARFRMWLAECEAACPPEYRRALRVSIREGTGGGFYVQVDVNTD